MVRSSTKSKSLDAYLSAALAHVRLLAGVDALMDSQSRSLDELLTAVGILTHVRADATVDTFYNMMG
jgi:hypothetical protein